MKSFKEFIGEAVRFKRSGTGYHSILTLVWNGNRHKSELSIYQSDNKAYWGMTITNLDSPHDSLNTTAYKLSDLRNEANNIYNYGLIYKSGDWYLDSEKWRKKEMVQR